ncbi:MAG: GNAT family N-acetyltransferase [Desulfobulbaceae bacterium]|uniref:GNAT family N-acetyltransferase n=1 Tax=Candidatus Desulfobia pelagia TaxID=2841692 RepID=A0A8J6NGN9_9BACT|nr:GNAT family N-acetyltransferase [Candidatus Desulfobia pelagia]
MITIRFAAGDDRQQLYTLVATIDNFTLEEKELAREVIYDGLESEKNGYHILVAVDSQETLAGFICYGPIPISVKRWDLYWIAVAPQQSRQGIGTLLLQAMEERLGKGGVRIYVDTSSTSGYTKARSFYERHGYEVACVLPDFYRTGDDKVVYCKEL